MFKQDMEIIKQKFQVGCLMLCGLFNGFALWHEVGFSPFYLIRAVPLTTYEITIAWIMLPFCLAVSLFSVLFAYLLFGRTSHWGKLLFVLFIGFNLTYFILSLFGLAFDSTHPERYFTESKIFFAVLLIVNLISLIPTLIIWTLTFAISKFFMPKTLR
jgi:hypothetical protein